MDPKSWGDYPFKAVADLDNTAKMGQAGEGTSQFHWTKASLIAFLDTLYHALNAAPPAHASSHEAGGSDELEIALSQIPGLGTAAEADVGDFATPAQLAAHEADTTSVHGITDTAQIALKNAANIFLENLTASKSLRLTSGATWTLDALNQEMDTRPLLMQWASDAFAGLTPLSVEGWNGSAWVDATGTYSASTVARMFDTNPNTYADFNSAVYSKIRFVVFAQVNIIGSTFAIYREYTTNSPRQTGLLIERASDSAMTSPSTILNDTLSAGAYFQLFLGTSNNSADRYYRITLDISTVAGGTLQRYAMFSLWTARMSKGRHNQKPYSVDTDSKVTSLGAIEATGALRVSGNDVITSERHLKNRPYTKAGAPAASARQDEDIVITDADDGAAGTHRAKCTSDGTNWINLRTGAAA